ncbi:glycosyltransferase family 2 protein [Ensifer sp. ENS03]|uniref:glycosyltransferase family 2 protein n=1 Tax=Ensifer sp. ENS03 TaxID=2769283 RepID=UPI00177E5E61|nr:glycosyltransferase family 2 protein [Ensifer sp. ENS03]MBD9559589.1 glycosyltransferase family 2 protein [Ensifer sp. ENS03]
MADAKKVEFKVQLKAAPSYYANHPVILTVKDPNHRLGLRPRLGLHRRGRVPATVFRSFLVNAKGRGRFYGWMPVQFDGVTLIADEATAEVWADVDPGITIRRLSLLEIGLRLVLQRPLFMLRVLRLLLAFNLKGATFRFARQVDAMSAPSYSEWIGAQQAAERAELPDTLPTNWPTKPLVVVSIVGDIEEAIAQTRASLIAQTWRHHVEISPDKVANIKERDAVRPLLWMRVPAGMRLAPRALEALVRPFALSQSVVAVYCDEDRLTKRGRRVEPFLKPAWNPPLAKSGWLALDGALIRVADLPDELDLEAMPMGEVIAKAANGRRDAVFHIPRVLLHRDAPRQRVSGPARLPSEPLELPHVSVIIPTRDRADLLEACLRGLFESTSGVVLDVIVIDNDSSDPKTLALMERYREVGKIRRLPLPGEFNFSKACNIGVGASRYELILLLNNDVEPLQPDWLAKLARELDDPSTGAAGSLLFFPDGYVQHGGVTLGAGTVARHTFHFLHPESVEDHGLLRERREVSAVTAACLLTRKSLWVQTGGMDENNLKVAFNDVDYCVKVRQAGSQIVWTPQSVLVHKESVSRGADNTPEKLRRFAAEERTVYQRWGDLLRNDPYHNPNLSLIAEDYVLEAYPRDLSPRTSQ